MDFLQELEEKVDLILYAGDDISRFNNLSYDELPEEIQQELAYKFNEANIDINSVQITPFRGGRIDFDFVFFHGKNVFEEIAKYSKNGLCVIAGNDDLPFHKLGIMGQNVFSVHKSPYFIDKDIAIIGSEGSTGEIGALLYTEKEVEEHLNNMLKRAGNRKIIIVSHSPPHKILDFAIRFGKRNIGSKALKSFIDANFNRIILVVCGHVHLQGGKEQLYQGVPIVNCASHDREYEPGRIALIELQDHNITTTWKLLHNYLNELMSVYLVGNKRAQVLIDNNILSVKEFYELPIDHELATHPSFKGSFELLQSYAEAVIKDKIIIKKQTNQYYKSLKGKNIYFFDAEYDPEQTSSGPYGIFLLGWMDFKGNVQQLFLEDPKDEKRMLEEFIKFIEEHHPCFIAYSSTSADLPHLRNAFKRFKLNTAILDNLFSDFFRDIISTQSSKRQEIFFPLRKLGIKELSSFLKYPRPDLEINDGLIALNKYDKYLKTKKEEKKKRIKGELLKYNEDDLKSLAFVYKKIYQEYFSP
jgi:Icc-related predicted phosphoesterase/uncharacterized protein YprB with RNaseH-like and TPR domain